MQDTSMIQNPGNLFQKFRIHFIVFIVLIQNLYKICIEYLIFISMKLLIVIFNY